MNAFIAKIKDGAISAQKKYGVLASLTIAQAILETGWGKASVGNNIFGIKAGGSWTGGSVSARTREWNGKAYVTITAAFRAYASIAASIEDHAALLAGNSRYKNIIGCTDYKQVCRYIQADGYATDPGYASKLISLIEQYGLHQFDAPKVDPNYCDTTGTLTLCPGMTYQFKTGSTITCANSALAQTAHTAGVDGYHYTKFTAKQLCAGVGMYVNGKRVCIVVVKKPACDTSTVTKHVGEVYQFKTDFPLVCGNGAIWKQIGMVHQGGWCYTKFQAKAKGSAGFYCGSSRVCVGTEV